MSETPQDLLKGMLAAYDLSPRVIRLSPKGIKAIRAVLGQLHDADRVYLKLEAERDALRNELDTVGDVLCRLTPFTDHDRSVLDCATDAKFALDALRAEVERLRVEANLQREANRSAERTIQLGQQQLADAKAKLQGRINQVAEPWHTDNAKAWAEVEQLRDRIKHLDLMVDVGGVVANAKATARAEKAEAALRSCPTCQERERLAEESRAFRSDVAEGKRILLRDTAPREEGKRILLAKSDVPE